MICVYSKCARYHLSGRRVAIHEDSDEDVEEDHVGEKLPRRTRRHVTYRQTRRTRRHVTYRYISHGRARDLVGEKLPEKKGEEARYTSLHIMYVTCP